MRRRFRILAMAGMALLAAVLLPTVAIAQEGALRIGAAAVVITPPEGTPMAGYYHERAADGVHDDLFAKAIVLESGGSKAALVALDLISTTRDMVGEARALAEKATGIAGGSVMISATHSHTGPVLAGRGVREADFGGASEKSRAYRASLPAKIAEAVALAHGKLAPARALATRGREDSIAFNRRYHMRDGSVGWNPGKLNPQVVKPAGPIDPEVPIVFFETDDKARKPLALYVNHAVHLDNIGGLMISADLPGVFSRLMAEVKGPDLVTLWTNGCCGDINHINVRWAQPQSGHENASRMGIILTAAVLRAWPSLAPVAAGPLRATSAVVPLPLPEITAKDIEEANRVVERRRDPKAKPPSFLEQVQAYKVLDVERQQGKPREVEVQVIALGNDIAWVSLPGEIFVEIGLAIKQDSPFAHTIVAELANGSVGYIPTRRAYTQGNYEVVSARVAEGSGEMLVDAAVAMLKKLYAERAAETVGKER